MAAETIHRVRRIDMRQRADAQALFVNPFKLARVAVHLDRQSDSLFESWWPLILSVCIGVHLWLQLLADVRSVSGVALLALPDSPMTARPSPRRGPASPARGPTGHAASPAFLPQRKCKEPRCTRSRGVCSGVHSGGQSRGRIFKILIRATAGTAIGTTMSGCPPQMVTPRLRGHRGSLHFLRGKNTCATYGGAGSNI
jgi:hypothetical protein